MTSIAASPRVPTQTAIVNNGLAQAAPLRFWLIGLGLVVYVGLCTGFRDNVWGADAWEHDRAILALTQQLWHAGNPTFATPEPSVRYSPYTIVVNSP